MNESNYAVEQKAYYWKYDDGSFGFVLVQKREQEKPGVPCINTAATYLDQGVYKNKQQLKTKLKMIQEQCREHGYAFKKKELKIKAGVQYVSKDKLADRKGKKQERSWEELMRFLNSCGIDSENRREMLRLFSGVLSGYCARMIVPLVPASYSVPLQERAPVLVLNSNDKTFSTFFDFISKAMASLTVPAHTRSKLRLKCPACLPRHLGEKSLEQCAYLRYKKHKNRFPAQYRDTAVLIYGRFFPASEIYQFIERNRWTASVLFDAPSKVSRVQAIRLKTASLVCKDFSWDIEDVNYLVEMFVLSLSKLWGKKLRDKKLKKRLNNIENCFIRYYSQKGIQRFNPTENYFMMLQMLTLELFLDGCVDEKIISREEKKKTQYEWFNLLLPGCRQYLKPEEETISDEIQSEEDRFRKIFEEALTRMLTEDNLRHFLPVTTSGEYEKADPHNPSLKYWGYLRWYAPKNKLKNAFRALQFIEDQFIIHFADFLSESCDVEDLISELRGNYKPEYLFGTEKARFPGITNKPIGTLIFKVEKMEFLPEETRKVLLDMIPANCEKK